MLLEHEPNVLPVTQTYILVWLIGFEPIISAPKANVLPIYTIISKELYKVTIDNICWTEIY